MNRSFRMMFRQFTTYRLLVTLIFTTVVVIAAYKLYHTFHVGQTERIFPDIPFASQERDTQRYVFAIVFDAGSTGTRLHAYRFLNNHYVEPPAKRSLVSERRVDPENGPSGPRGPQVHGYQPEPNVIVRSSTRKGLQLVDELFREVKPGLSSFAQDPAEAADSIEPLLTLAKEYVPRDVWNSVPVALYATAGLRLLSDPVAQSILDETRSLLKNYPFQLCSECVRILDGLDEGVYAWYTINSLLGLTDELTKHKDDKQGKDTDRKSKHSVGVIDLGGASLQITFLAHSTHGVPQNFLYETDKFGSKLTVYTHSYLGLGLNAARMQLLTELHTQLQSDNTETGKQSRLKSNIRRLQPSEEKASKTGMKRAKRDAKKNDAQDIVPLPNVTYTSPCLYEGYEGTFRFQNVDVRMRGLVRSTTDTNDRFEPCYKSAQLLVSSPRFSMHQPREVRIMPFYIQSYFFDRAVDAGLINQNEGGSLTLEDYERAAKSSCNLPKQAEKLPFLCMDLCYIVALLRDGFQFDPSSTLMVMKKIQNFELSWTLGAAYPLLSHLSD